MPRDVLIANVVANEPPTIIVPSFRSSYEDMDITLPATAYNGRPAATALGLTVHADAFDALRNINPSYRSGNAEALDVLNVGQLGTSNTIRIAGSRVSITANINVPPIAGTRPKFWYLRWTIGYPGTDGNPDLSRSHAVGYTIFKILQSIRSSIMIASSFTREETTDIVLPFNYNIGSPKATQVVHSWHSTLAYAVAGTNRVTANRPTVAVDPTPTGLSEYNIDSGRLDRAGGLTMRTPAVTSRTELYGRVEIWQPPLSDPTADPVMVDSDAYTLIVTNRSEPMLAVEHVREVEGTRTRTAVRYVGENIPGDRWEINYAETRQRAIDENWLTDDDLRRPTRVTYEHDHPRQGPNERQITMRISLPYVDQNETIWARLTMVVVNPVDGTESYTHAYFRIVIRDRVEACVELGPDVTFDEQVDNFAVQCWYNEGLPPATTMDVTVHQDETYALLDRDPLTGANELRARLSITNITPTDNPTARVPFTLYLSSPDIALNEDWGVRVDINQSGYGPDPIQT